MNHPDDDEELLGRLVAEYSEEINRLRAALRWVFEHSSDPRAADRALQALGPQTWKASA
jgi:hypothetical protein